MSKDLLIGGNRMNRWTVYAQAATEGLIDPEQVSEQDFLEGAPTKFEPFGLSFKEHVGVWNNYPADIGVVRIVRNGLCGSRDALRAESAVSDLIGCRNGLARIRNREKWRKGPSFK